MSASAFEFRESSQTPAEHFVYILHCADGSLYVGHTSDVDERVRVHNDGRGALWTACRRPVTVVYQEQHSSEPSAISWERQLKRWTHAKKRALIEGDKTRLSLGRATHPLTLVSDLVIRHLRLFPRSLPSIFRQDVAGIAMWRRRFWRDFQAAPIRLPPAPPTPALRRRCANSISVPPPPRIRAAATEKQTC